jgi:ankyrin repeat protein
VRHRGRRSVILGFEVSDQERILAAARAGDAAAVERLLARDPALVGAVDAHRKTPLHLAAEHDHAEVAELLIEAGADLEAWTTWGTTPLEWAGVLGSRRTGDALVRHGARLTLGAAAGLGRLDAVRAMSEGGAISPAFVLACRNGHTDVARFLLDSGADVNARGIFAATGLHWAAINGHTATVRFLLDHGADPSLRDTKFDSDALGWAREGGHAEVVALLEA